MFDIPTPNVKSIYRNKECNFTLEIMAYRKLNENEIRLAVRQYMSVKKITKLPHNKTVTWIATFE